MDKRINIEAERAAFDKALAASFPDMPAREDGGAQNAKFVAFAMFQAGIAFGRATGAMEDLPPLPEPACKTSLKSATGWSSFVDVYTAEQYRQGQREAIAHYQRKQAGQVGAAPRDYFAWWTSIETDVRKSMLVFAHREPERLHALVRQAYEAGQQSVTAAGDGQEGEQPTIKEKSNG